MNDAPVSTTILGAGGGQTSDRTDAGQLRQEAVAVHDALMQGGVAIVPMNVAYAVIGRTAGAITRIFAAKRRSYEKPSGLIGNIDFSKALHRMEPDRWAVIQALLAADLPFSIVAEFDLSHPLLSNVDPFVMQNSSKAGTLDILMNAGPFHNALAAVAFERGAPVFGSSANLSLTGSRYTLADVSPEIRAIATIEVDHGESLYANADGRSSTIIDFRTYSVIRRGVCFDRITRLLADQFGIELTPS